MSTFTYPAEIRVFGVRTPSDDAIHLETPTLKHAVELSQLIAKNHERLAQWFHWAHSSAGKTAAYIEKCLYRQAEGTGLTTLMIQHGTIIGSIGFTHIKQHHQRAALSYWIDEDYEGKGLVQAGARALLEEGFTNLNLNRVVAYCDEENDRGNCVAESLGFAHEGTLEEHLFVNGEFRHVALWALLRSRWERS